VKELFQKLGLSNNKDKKTEIKTNKKPEEKAKENGEKISGIDFNRLKKENTIKGCSFTEEKM